MKQSLPELIHAARLALTEAVRPELTSDHARGQLAGVVDILAKLDRMVVWSPQALGEQQRLLQDGCDAFAARVAQEQKQEEGPSKASLPPAAVLEAGAPVEAALQATEERVMQLTDWLYDPSRTLGAETRADLDRILQQALRQSLVVERKQIPLTDFTAMTSAAAPATAKSTA
jgi:hypothetical protein